MQVYRDRLLEVVPSGGEEITCWPPKGTPAFSSSRYSRIWAKKVSYPRRVGSVRDIDLVHFLDHSSAYLIPSVRSGLPVVATLHDLIPLRFQGELSGSQIDRFRRNVTNLRKCDALVSVSEYSKKEAIELLDIDPEKITVIPNGVSLPARSKKPSKFVKRLREVGVDFLVLSVGSTRERKNLSILPEAMASFERVSGKKGGLLRIGGKLNDTLVGELASLLGERFVEAGPLNDEDLWACYQNCDTVFIPSHFEGFGLPIIEAFSCGRAVACSGSSSLPEVGGAFAHYFDPKKGEDAGHALAKCFQEHDDQRCISGRLERAGQFTWQKHLQGISEVYESLRTVPR